MIDGTNRMRSAGLCIEIRFSDYKPLLVAVPHATPHRLVVEE